MHVHRGQVQPVCTRLLGCWLGRSWSPTNDFAGDQATPSPPDPCVRPEPSKGREMGHNFWLLLSQPRALADPQVPEEVHGRADDLEVLSACFGHGQNPGLGITV